MGKLEKIKLELEKVERMLRDISLNVDEWSVPKGYDPHVAAPISFVFKASVSPSQFIEKVSNIMEFILSMKARNIIDRR